MTNISIDEKLDTCASLLVQTYDEILKHRKLLNNQLDSGYINLSKARSIIGCNSLSILQVPNELSPNVTVNLTEDKLYLDNQVECDNLEFKLDIRKTKKIDDQGIDKIEDVKNIPLPSWFGVLTPMSLKNSQRSFADSLHLIRTICELQTRLQNLQITYNKLLADK